MPGALDGLAQQTDRRTLKAETLGIDAQALAEVGEAGAVGGERPTPRLPVNKIVRP